VPLPAIATTTVGSFPRPSWLGIFHDRSDVDFLIAGEGLREAQDDATVVVLKMQEEAGLDLLTDGEQRRPNFIYHVLSAMDGFDLTDRRHKIIRRRTNRLVPRVVGQVRRRAPALVDDVRFARAHTTRPLKMAVPGPMTVVDSTYYDDTYGDEERLAMDVAAALNAELLDLQAAGCDVVQIDEPAMTRYHEKVFDYGAAALDRCLQGVTVPVIVHLCYGYPGGASLQHQYTYPELLDRLMETRIAGFTVEFGRSTYVPAILKPYRERLFMFGCIDPGNTPAPTVDDVKRRIAGALDYLDPAKVMLSPDCGLMTISRDLAREKLRVMVAAAQDLRKGM
jgi:5-methyltetrahydropteroyltriglutamate--homocysteine methyltransferase